MTTTLPDTDRLATDLVAYLETGAAPSGLFADDVFCDFTPPLWRLQAMGVDDVLAIRRGGHPWPGEVGVRRCDPTPTGFVPRWRLRWPARGSMAGRPTAPYGSRPSPCNLPRTCASRVCSSTPSTPHC